MALCADLGSPSGGSGLALQDEVGMCVKCTLSLLTSRTGMPVVSKLFPAVPRVMPGKELVPDEEMVPLELAAIVRKLVLESAAMD